MAENAYPDETAEARVKRLRMRSMRRGIKEMDLILSAYADATLASMSETEITLYDRLLNENDQDLYAWVTGQTPAPEEFSEIVSKITVALHRN